MHYADSASSLVSIENLSKTLVPVELEYKPKVYSILFILKLVTGATINGNFSITTVLASRPKPRSSDKLIPFSQK